MDPFSAQALADTLTVADPPVYRDKPDLEKGKNIIVCADGTGNADVKGRGSNVFKLFEAVDTTTHLYNINVPRQIAFYHEGVGTESALSARIADGAFGLRVQKYVCDLYAEIARVYHPDDRLYLFGFSRGAFTVRALAELIDRCGILDSQFFETNASLRKAIAGCSATFLRGAEPDGEFRKRCHPRRQQPIEFVGVWDTVDAIGVPFPIADRINRRHPYKAVIATAPPSVRYGCHALSLDDEREAFTPTLWKDAPHLEQVWFAGAHSDIGGGYPRHGLSLIALHWMMERAAARGVRFIALDRDYYDQHQMVADAVHDPRTGLGLFYRWKPRDVEGLCRASGVDPQLHISVVDRIAQGVDGYAPTNIPAAKATGAPGGGVARGVLNFTDRRDVRYLNPPRIERAVQSAAARLQAASRESARDLSRGRFSYVLFLLGVLTGVAALVTAALWLAGEVTAIPALAPAGASVALLLVAWSIAQRTNQSLDARYSKLWHDLRPELRSSLARSEVAAV